MAKKKIIDDPVGYLRKQVVEALEEWDLDAARDYIDSLETIYEALPDNPEEDMPDSDCISNERTEE